MSEYEIKIEPSEYKGWHLSYCKQNSERNFRAAKAGDWRYAESLAELLREVDAAEQVALRLNPPMRVLFKDHYGTAFEPATIDAVVGGRLYLTTAKGQRTSNVENLHPPKDGAGSYGRDTIIHDSKANHAIMKRGVELLKKSKEIARQAEQMAGKVRVVTEADVLLAAKGKL